MAKALGALFFFLKGTPFVYQGQELGMINTHFDNIDELDDINSKGQYARCLEAGYSETEAMESVNIRSRDQSRLPMQWNSEKTLDFQRMSHGWHATISVTSRRWSLRALIRVLCLTFIRR